MKILKQIIEKKVSNAEELLLLRNKTESLNEHISAYMHSLVYLGYNDPDFKAKNKLWNQFMISLDSKNREKYYKKLLKHRTKELSIIFEALRKIEIEEQQLGYGMGDIYKPFSWAVLSYEFPED